MLLIYIIIALLCVVLPVALRRKAVGRASMILFVVAQTGIGLWSCLKRGATELGYFTFDPLGILMLTTLCIVAIAAAIHSGRYLDERNPGDAERGVYTSSFVLLVTALTLGYLSNHMAMTWVFTEVTTLSSALLIYHHRNKAALEGTWKYVFVCAISVSFVFIGILFMSLSLMHAGSSDLSYSSFAANAAQMDPFWMRLGYIFIVVGYTAKMGLFPMFTAGIDAKDNAPSPAGALLASVLVNLGFTGIFRTWSFVSNTSVMEWGRSFMIAIALVTLFVASVYMVKVHNLKRMLAYSGIEHMALVTLGLTMGKAGCIAALLHLIMHAFVKSGFFLHFSQLYRIYKSKMIDDMGGYFQYNGFGAIVLLLGFVSITAIPPSGLFVSEFLIFKSMFAAGNYVIFAVTAVLLTILIWAFARCIFRVIFLPAAKPPVEVPHIGAWESMTQLALFILAIYIGLNPPAALMEMIGQAINCIG